MICFQLLVPHLSHHRGKWGAPAALPGE